MTPETKNLNPRPGVEIVAVKVPEDAIRASISKATGADISIKCDFLFLQFQKCRQQFIQLPPGQYSLIGVSDEITEDKAAELVESVYAEWLGKRFKDYVKGQIYFCDTALESFQSFLKSNGMEGKWVLLKVIKN
jgi:hypothetical protein